MNKRMFLNMNNYVPLLTGKLEGAKKPIYYIVLKIEFSLLARVTV